MLGFVSFELEWLHSCSRLIGPYEMPTYLCVVENQAKKCSSEDGGIAPYIGVEPRDWIRVKSLGGQVSVLEDKYDSSSRWILDPSLEEVVSI